MPELLLPRLKREIAARLAELRPLVAEAERLEAAKEALLAEAAAEQRVRERKDSVRERARSIARGSTRTIRTNGTAAAATNGSAVAEAAETNGAHASKPAPAPAEAPAPAAPAAEEENGRASRGTNQSAILAIIEERPGVSVAEIASVTKIAKPTVATTVSKLKREGVLAAEAGGVKLASRQPVTLSQVADAAPVREDGVSDEEWEAARREGAVA